MQNFYTVRQGENLTSIAARWYIPLSSLIAANNLVPPYTIYPRQQLSMPPAVNTYVVKAGDSIYSISAYNGISPYMIINSNGIEPPYTIVPGQVLVILPGTLHYIVRPGDTLYGIARKYNVAVNGVVKPELIIQANPGTTQMLKPGMTLVIPYPPSGGSGRLAVTLNDDLNNYLQLYNPVTGTRSNLLTGTVDSSSKIFWSPDGTRLAVVGDSGIIYIVNISTKQLSKVDQITLPVFISWSPDSKKIVYSNQRVIRIYDITTNVSKNINRAGASYVQWLPGGTELIFEAKDTTGMSQLYRINVNGTNERQITNNNEGPLNDVRLSPNGRFVLYTSPGASISIIYVLELDTGRINRIPGGPEAKNYYPTWAPDSTKIAYSATQFINGRYYSQIRYTGITGQGDTIVAISSCYATPVTWSPDSQKIAYLSGCRADYPPVEVWSVDIGKPVPINALSGYKFYNLSWGK
jgi:TolB protein